MNLQKCLLNQVVISDCEERQPNITSKDQKSSRVHYAHNKLHKRIFHCVVDGQLITQVTASDFLLLNEDEQIAYFIETKGAKVAKAAQQLEITAKRLRADLSNYEYRFRIVHRKFPPETHNDAKYLSFLRYLDSLGINSSDKVRYGRHENEMHDDI